MHGDNHSASLQVSVFRLSKEGGDIRRLCIFQEDINSVFSGRLSDELSTLYKVIIREVEAILGK